MEERVAQAIWQAHKDNINRPMTAIYPLMARAAIEAMRTPTEAMLGDFPGLHADVWERMINAALTTGEMMSDFDDVCDLFTAYARTVADWKHCYEGAAYSTRLRAAIADMKFAIEQAERNPEIGFVRPWVWPRRFMIGPTP